MKAQIAQISFCIIVKNEPILEQCLQSIRDHVEEIIVVDTGSTDNTPEVAKKYADIFRVYTDCNNPNTGLIEDFSKARNYSFSLASHTKVGWIDADDEISGISNLYSLLQDCDAKHTANGDCYSLLFPYEYSYDANGKCTCRHYRERIFSDKNCFHFTNPVHEVAIVNDGLKVQLISDDSIVYKHRRQYSNKPVDPGRNLRILKKYIEGAGKDDARQMYYIGLEYYNNGFVNEAIGSLTKYIEISGWDDERVMACLKLVDICQGLAQYQEGLKWAFKALEINETWAEGYLAAGRMFYFLAQTPNHQQFRNWQRCVHFIRTGLSMPPTKTLLFINPMEREFEIHKYLNVALNAIGDVKGALESVNFGLQSQTDPMLLGNKALYEKHFAIQQIYSSLDTLKNNKSIDDKAAEIVLSIVNNMVPTNYLLNQKIADVVSMPNGKYDIVFFIGQGVEEWTPETIKKTGIGGSELMASEISKRLAKLGNRVRVYNSCGSGEGVYDGVEYYRTEKYQNIKCDVLIVSRLATMINYNVDAKLKLLWVHDVFALGDDTCLHKYDRILALSEWHKQNLINYHRISGDYILVTRNGIDLNRFNKQINRNRYRVVCSSSPDRYLPVLLDCWMDIKTQVPQATLDIFYGFKNWEFVAQNDSNQLALINRLKAQMEMMKPVGVNFRDRVNQERLAEEYLSAGVWAFSTWFNESSCISAMEAQAAGLRIVTSPIAALNETVADRGTMIPGDWTSEEYKKKFVEAVVAALQKEDDSDRLALQQYAKSHFDLDTLAQDWEKMFKSLMKNTETTDDSPIVGYNTFLGNS